MTLGQSWTATRGNGVRMMPTTLVLTAAYAVVCLFAAIPLVLLALLAGDSTLAQVITSALMTLVLMLLGLPFVVMLSVVYAFLIRGKTM